MSGAPLYIQALGELNGISADLTGSIPSNSPICLNSTPDWIIFSGNIKPSNNAFNSFSTSLEFQFVNSTNTLVPQYLNNQLIQNLPVSYSNQLLLQNSQRYPLIADPYQLTSFHQMGAIDKNIFFVQAQLMPSDQSNDDNRSDLVPVQNRP